MNKFKLIKIVIVFIFSLFYSKLLYAENLYINSSELSHLEKIKNIKNKKKQNPRKDGVYKLIKNTQVDLRTLERAIYSSSDNTSFETADAMIKLI